MADLEDRDWQRLDKWLWCARFMKARSDCARFVVGGLVRINRQPTDKAHARLRIGDVLTLPVPAGPVPAGPVPSGPVPAGPVPAGPVHAGVRVIRVAALAARRGPAAEARLLYEEILGP